MKPISAWWLALPAVALVAGILAVFIDRSQITSSTDRFRPKTQYVTNDTYVTNYYVLDPIHGWVPSVDASNFFNGK